MQSLTHRTRIYLEHAHPEWRRLIIDVNNVYPIEVIDSFRNEHRQNIAFARGSSKVQWPNSKHNTDPSLAIDVINRPFTGWADGHWNDIWHERVKFYETAAIMKAFANRYNHRIRWGGDWNGDSDYTNDGGFSDLVHFELIINGWKRE